LQEVAKTPDGLALLRVPEPEIADLVEAARQHVLEETAHEFLTAEAAKSPTSSLTLLVAQADMVVVETNNTGVGEGDAEDIASQVVEHGLLAGPPQGDVGDPGDVPDAIGDDDIRTALSK
jgi:hypothetical protein